MPTGKKKPAKAPGKTPKGASPKMKDVVKSAMLMEGGTKAPNMATPESRLPPPFDSKKRLGLTEVPSISEIRSDGTSGSADTSHGITGPNSASAAYMSPTLRRMLVTQKQDLKPWNVSEFLVNYPSMIVNKVASYLVYKENYEKKRENPPAFVVEPAIVLEVLMASQFLEI